MKLKLRKSLLVTLAFIFGVVVYADTDNDSKVEQGSSAVPIVIRKKKSRVTYAPSKGIEIFMTYSEKEITFFLPSDFYPAEIRISGMEKSSGYWTSTLDDVNEVMYFDGGVGDYCLEIETSGLTYIGYFTLE